MSRETILSATGVIPQKSPQSTDFSSTIIKPFEKFIPKSVRFHANCSQPGSLAPSAPLWVWQGHPPSPFGANRACGKSLEQPFMQVSNKLLAKSI